MSTVPSSDESTTTALSDADAFSPDQGAQSAEIVSEWATRKLPTEKSPTEAAFLADAIEDKVEFVPARSWPVRVWHTLGSACEWLIGLVSLLVGVAIVASIPVLQLISLGYLLEVSGRISRSGRLRDGLFEIREAARIGGLFLGTWLMILPLRFVSDMASSARLIASDSGVATAWQIGLQIATWIMVAHIVLAWYSGGRLRHFLWPLLAPLFFAMWLFRHAVSLAVTRSFLQPLLRRMSPRLLSDLTTIPALNTWFPPAILWEGLRQGGVYQRCRDAVWEFTMGMRLPYYFWLGLRGFVGAAIWLIVPVLMMVGTTRLSLNDPEAASGLGALLGLTGSLLLAVVMLYLPFLQAHFAAEGRFRAMFAWQEVRHLFRRAPIAFWVALLSTLLFAIPLYLLKIEFIPREVIWLPSLVFVVFIFPARMITGWALGRARHHSVPRHAIFRCVSRLAAIPVVAAYVLIVYFTQYISWYGAWSLFEQHAVLTPVPFLGI